MSKTENRVNPWDADTARDIIEKLKSMPGALLPILNRLQDEFGYIAKETIPILAEELNVSLAEVQGTISFYHGYRDKAPGEHIIRICRAESCQANNSKDLIEHTKDKLGIDFAETSSDNKYTLEPVYCLGNCACGPSIEIDKKLYGRMTPDKFDDLLEDINKGGKK